MTSKPATPTPDDAAGRVARLSPAERRRRLLRLVGAAVVFGVSVAAVLIVLNLLGGDDEAAPADRTAIRAPREEIDQSIPRDGRSLGDPGAPVVVAEYADYQCSFCAAFAINGMPRLLGDHVAGGRVRLEYHHLVVIDADGPDGESFRAAEAAECARDQGRFWEYHELLFANSLGEYRGSFTPERLKAIGERVDDLDRDAFAGCVDARTHRDAVVRMREEASAAGVTTTPTFLVDGEVVAGGADALTAAIEARLGGG